MNWVAGIIFAGFVAAFIFTICATVVEMAKNRKYREENAQRRRDDHYFIKNN